MDCRAMSASGLEGSAGTVGRASGMAKAGEAVLKLYGRRTSINVRKVLWTCDETGIPYLHDPHAHPKSKTVLDLNPNGLVPVVTNQNLVLWESNTICRFIARRQGRDDLLPRDPMQCAAVEQWMDWTATTVNSAWRFAFMALVRKDPAFMDPVQVNLSKDAWNKTMTILDEQLTRTGAYVVGGRFTLADIIVGLAVQRWRSTPMERPKVPAVDDYFARLRDRKPFRMHVDNGEP